MRSKTGTGNLDNQHSHAMVELGNRVKTTSKSGAVLLGTVKFVGKHHTKGEDRVGIELDDPVGKHNGTVKVRVVQLLPPLQKTHSIFFSQVSFSFQTSRGKRRREKFHSGLYFDGDVYNCCRLSVVCRIPRSGGLGFNDRHHIDSDIQCKASSVGVLQICN